MVAFSIHHYNPQPNSNLKSTASKSKTYPSHSKDQVLANKQTQETTSQANANHLNQTSAQVAVNTNQAIA